MSALLLRTRVSWRQRWPSLLALALLIAVAGAVTLTAVAGARRTQSAPARFMREDGTPDVLVVLHGLNSLQATREIASRPEVQEASIGAGMSTLPYTKEGAYLPSIAAIDGKIGVTVLRGRLMHGRRADPRAHDEIVLSESHANQLHARVGDRVPMLAFDEAQTRDCLYDDTGPSALCRRLFTTPRFSLRVVGIIRTAADINSRATDITLSVLGTGFFEHYRHDLGWAPVVAVRLRPHVSQESFITAVRRIPGAADATFEPLNGSAAKDAVNVLTAALALFALVAALAGALAVGQAIVRQVGASDGDRAVLSSLGATRTDEVADAVAPIAVAAAGGVALAVAGAFAASQLMPIGFARRLDPSPGRQVDRIVIGGALVIFVLGVACAAVAAYRLSRVRSRDRRVRRASPMWSPRTGSPAAFVGLRNATSPGRGRDAVPVRSAIVGVAAAAAGVIAVLSFSAGLSHLVDTPRLYGWSFDIVGIDPRYERAVASDPDVEALGRVRRSLQLRVDGRPTLGTTVQPIIGEMTPAILAGRAPIASDEVALGADTLHAAHTRIGGTVDVVGPRARVRMHVVGEGVFPTGADAFPLADGAYVAPVVVARLGKRESFENLAVRLRPGADKSAAFARLDALDATSDPSGSPPDRPVPPAEIEKLQQVDAVPRILAAFLLVLGMIALAHALVVGVRRRARDYAVLRALGFRRRGVRSAVAWEAGAIAGAGALLGIPIGVLFGRLAWARTARTIGVLVAQQLPTLVVVLAVPASIAFAVVVAQMPARRAVRLRTAEILRSE
jgi:FtsX-like permease family